MKETVTEILDTKSGTGKNGKPYTMTKVETTSGKQATTFNTIAVGDEVELEYNEQFKNYNVVNPKFSKPQGSLQKPDTLRLDKIEKEVHEILDMVKSLVGRDVDETTAEDNPFDGD